MIIFMPSHSMGYGTSISKDDSTCKSGGGYEALKVEDAEEQC